MHGLQVLHWHHQPCRTEPSHWWHQPRRTETPHWWHQPRRTYCRKSTSVQVKGLHSLFAERCTCLVLAETRPCSVWLNFRWVFMYNMIYTYNTYTWRNKRSCTSHLTLHTLHLTLLLVLHTPNNTNGNKLTIFSSIGLYKLSVAHAPTTFVIRSYRPKHTNKHLWPRPSACMPNAVPLLIMLPQS